MSKNNKISNLQFSNMEELLEHCGNDLDYIMKACGFSRVGDSYSHLQLMYDHFESYGISEPLATALMVQMHLNYDE